MSGKLQNIALFSIDWKSSVPVMRYVLGSCFILGVTALMNYDLAYLTSVLSLGFMAPGARPLSFKKAAGFVLILILITGTTVIFTELFLDYALVFFPLLLLSLLWLYYTDKLPLVIKLLALISLIIIPLVSIDGSAIGSYIAVRLVFNAFMAIILSQIVFWAFPICEADAPFEKKQKEVQAQSESQRLSYAVNIILLILPVLLLFYIFKLSSSILILTFVAILSISPSLANKKAGLVMILANILGGIFGILAYKLLVMVPNFIFMILLTLAIGLFFANKLFSDNKFAGIFGSAFSTFLLILGSVTASDAEAGSKVWSRVVQIGIAVSYVVMAFAILNYFLQSKTRTGS